MKVIQLSKSLPQPAFEAKALLENEGKIAESRGVFLYTLMERAGATVFAQLQHCYQDLNSLLIVCGKGNNGGDGLVVARLAKEAGIAVSVLMIAKDNDIKGDALTAFQALWPISVSENFTLKHTTNVDDVLDEIDSFHGQVIVDCLFGIGFKGELSAPLQRVITHINTNSAKVLSVDIPSGLLANTGRHGGTAVIAEQTMSFIAFKQGLLTAQAANYVGELYLSDLGIGDEFIKQVQANVFIQGQSNLPLLTKRLASSHKGNIGLILAIGGNEGMPGAIRLSAEAALRSGVSLMAVCCHPDSQEMVFNGRPELMLAPTTADKLPDAPFFKKIKSMIIGPGLGQDLWAQELFAFMLDKIKGQTQSCVVDADALHLLSQSGAHRNNWVLTPHVGEAAILLGCSVEDIENDRFAAVKAIADKYGGICVLKGAGTLISDGKVVWINTSGNAGMASGGMGDVLSGIIAAMLIQFSDPLEAVRFAVYIHGQAADIIADKNGQCGLLASDLFPEIQKLVN